VIDMTTSAPRRARYRPWLVAAMASSAVLVPAMTATATWQNSSITLIEFRDVCHDGVRFGGAVRVGTADNDPQYKTMAVAAQPPPGAWGDKPPLAMRTAIKIPRLPAPEDIIVDDDPNNTAAVSHMGSFTLRYGVAALDLAPMALNIQDGDPQSSVNTADVTDCYLFAPIDVVPGSSSNKVPIGHGDVNVAVLTTDAMDASALNPKTFRFGPKKAAKKGKALRDVNADNRPDLVLRFGSVPAGLTCKTRTVHLTGQSPSGGKLEAKGTVTPTGCSS
jgi:hypothetical protein